MLLTSIRTSCKMTSVLAQIVNFGFGAPRNLILLPHPGVLHRGVCPLLA